MTGTGIIAYFAANINCIWLTDTAAGSPHNDSASRGMQEFAPFRQFSALVWLI